MTNCSKKLTFCIARLDDKKKKNTILLYLVQYKNRERNKKFRKRRKRVEEIERKNSKKKGKKKRITIFQSTKLSVGQVYYHARKERIGERGEIYANSPYGTRNVLCPTPAQGNGFWFFFFLFVFFNSTVPNAGVNYQNNQSILRSIMPIKRNYNLPGIDKANQSSTNQDQLSTKRN